MTTEKLKSIVQYTYSDHISDDILLLAVLVVLTRSKNSKTYSRRAGIANTLPLYHLFDPRVKGNHFLVALLDFFLSCHLVVNRSHSAKSFRPTKYEESLCSNPDPCSCSTIPGIQRETWGSRSRGCLRSCGAGKSGEVRWRVTMWKQTATHLEGALHSDPERLKVA